MLLTGVGAGAGGAEDVGLGLGAVVGVAVDVVLGVGVSVVVGVTVGVGVGVGVVVGTAHATQNTFCLAKPCSPVKFQKSL